MFGRPQVRFAVCVGDPSFHFHATHAILFEGKHGILEPEEVHGHDYQARLLIEGPLDPMFRVVDLTPLEDVFHKILKAWDDRVILPKDYVLEKNSTSGSQKIFYIKEKNPTTELIAGFILRELIDALEKKNIVPRKSYKKYSFTLRLTESLGTFSEASIGKRFNSKN